MREQQKNTMSVAAFVCSYKRPSVLAATLDSILSQTIKIQEVVVSLVRGREDDLPGKYRDIGAITVLYAELGHTRQANTAINHLNTNNYDLIAAFDDDVELHSKYIENAVYAFTQDDEILALTGNPILNGNISRETAVNQITKYESENKIKPDDFYYNRGNWHLYGCNIVFNAKVLKTTQFDEQLPLQGFMDDLDISLRIQKLGKMVCSNACILVHLITPTSRFRGFTFGVAQIAVPNYLKKKGLFTNSYFLKTISRYCLVNLYGFFINKNTKYDRIQRFIGNIYAVTLLLFGRLDLNKIQE